MFKVLWQQLYSRQACKSSMNLSLRYRWVSLTGCGLALLRKVLRFESLYVHVMAGLWHAAMEPASTSVVCCQGWCYHIDVSHNPDVQLASWCHKVTRSRSVHLPLPRSTVIQWHQQVTRMWHHPSHVCMRQYHCCWIQSTRWWIYMLVLVSVGLLNYYGSS